MGGPPTALLSCTVAASAAEIGEMNLDEAGETQLRSPIGDGTTGSETEGDAGGADFMSTIQPSSNSKILNVLLM